VENAIDVYNKLGDSENILQLYVEAKNWPSAFALVKKHPQYEAALYMPYAQWLVENDKFVEAQKGERVAS
jgi:intraflagellar transport protein 122